MSSNKYITYIYKITTKENKIRLFIGSTRENLQTLLLFFIKDLKTDRKNNLYNWIRPLDTSKLKIKLIKSYPVSDKDEQQKREKYWIKKYKNYGYEVLHNPFQSEKKENPKEKIYVCLENVTMESIIKKYGDKIISISRNGFSPSNNTISSTTPTPPPIMRPTSVATRTFNVTKPKKPLPVNQGDSYLNELKNLLTMRKTSDLSVAELAKKNKPNIVIQKDKIKIKKTVFKPPKPIINPGQELINELKRAIKKIE